MDQFRVKKTSLKAIARTPDFTPPKKAKRVRKPQPTRIGTWMSATLGDLKGNDFSAYGVRKKDGSIALKEVPANSAAAKASLIEGDLIQGVNGQAVCNQRQFSITLRRLSAETLKLKIIRNQKASELELKLDKKLSFKIIPPVSEKK